MHPLIGWMEKAGKTQAETATALSITQGFLSRVLHGKKRFSPELAARAEKMTRGKVSFRDLLYPSKRAAS